MGGARPRSVILSKGMAPMKLSARNQIKGRVVEVRKGATTAHVRIDIGNGVVITSSITNEAVDELGLGVGDEAIAVIKASDVMVGK
jgi:molybdopterin-binding protein